VSIPTDGAAAPVSLRVRVKRERCQGHARCVALAPELFEVDAFGEAREIADGWVSSHLENKAWLARANCPELAIEVEIERAGEVA
jgi:ferredoxin